MLRLPDGTPHRGRQLDLLQRVSVSRLVVAAVKVKAKPRPLRQRLHHRLQLLDFLHPQAGQTRRKILIPQLFPAASKHRAQHRERRHRCFRQQIHHHTQHHLADPKIRVISAPLDGDIDHNLPIRILQQSHPQPHRQTRRIRTFHRRTKGELVKRDHRCRVDLLVIQQKFRIHHQLASRQFITRKLPAVRAQRHQIDVAKIDLQIHKLLRPQRIKLPRNGNRPCTIHRRLQIHIRLRQILRRQPRHRSREMIHRHPHIRLNRTIRKTEHPLAQHHFADGKLRRRPSRPRRNVRFPA